MQFNLRLFFLHAVAALLIAINWGVFIWASIHGRVLESSIGYLIAPILSVVIGVVVYKERVSAIKSVAMAVMITGVLVLLTLSNGLDERVYLSIGISWGFYSCLKKMTSLNIFSGLLLESSVLAVFCTMVLFVSNFSMNIPADFGMWRTLMVFCCGLVSIIPLALYSFSAKKLSMTYIGLIQFVLPITQFFVAAIIYKQIVSPLILAMLLTVMSGLLLVVVEPVIRKVFFTKKGWRDET